MSEPGKAPPPLPELRQDLRLMPGARRPGGAPSWLIYDPLQHRYIQIDQRTFELLSMWSGSADVEALREAARAGHGLTLEAADIGQLIEFAHAHGLTVEPPKGSWRQYLEQSRRGRHGWAMWLVHNYLFFRIPLWRPEGFLAAASPTVTPLFTRPAAMLLAAIAAIGLYLASRQWSAFSASFYELLTLNGALAFGAVLFVLKGVHELGHAFTAHRYGCRVPTIGIAFMLMTPLLYCDVTDAWKLTSRRKRMAIDMAGVAAELGVAAIATLLWAFLEDGTARSVCFVVATASWVMSLAVNLNPFMRFDGYYILSDLLGVENLQTRAFAIGRWWLRELLFRLGAEPPELLPAPLRRTLIAYAVATALYRLVLYVGIALVVYHCFFKLLGIILFLVEMVFFIARPIWSELKEWQKMRKLIATSRRAYVSGGLVLAGLVLAAVPVSTRVAIPAVIEADHLARLFPVRPAQVRSIEVALGDRVQAGAVIARLASPDIAQEIKITEAELALTRMRLQRRVADDVDREESLVLDRQHRALLAKLEGLRREETELVVRAPAAGVVLELNPALHPGRWIGRLEPVAAVGDPEASVGAGYVSEADLWRLLPGSTGRFVPDDPLEPSRELRVGDIAYAGSSAIDIRELASVYGGRVPATLDHHDRLVPNNAEYLVRLQPVERRVGASRRVRGQLLAEGRPESLASRIWRQTLKVLVREAGA